MFDTIPLEFLFFALPCVLAGILTLPISFVFSRLRSRWPSRAFPVALLIGFFFGGFVFLFLAGALLFGLGLPGDENAGEVVVLFLWNAAIGTGVSQIVYWFLFFWSGRKPG